MKFRAVTFAIPAILCAQSPVPQSPIPSTVVPPAQVSPPQVPPGGMPAEIPADAVVIEVEGKKYTKAEVDKLIASMPVQVQPQLRTNPQLITQVFVFREMERMAIEEKLDQESPMKEQLAFLRTQNLAQAEANKYRYSKITVTPEQEQKYYAAHSGDGFRAAKARVIRLAFRPPNALTEEAKKQRTEEEAKAKAEELRKQLVAGADFGALAKANSDDKASAEQGGDYGLITQQTSSEALKTVVFKLKPGEISEPVKQPNGFYLVKVDEFVARPFDQVQAAINELIRQEKFKEWQQSLQKQYAVKVENQSYFQQRPVPAGFQGAQPPTRPVVPPNVK